MNTEQTPQDINIRETLLKLSSAKELKRSGGGYYTQSYIKKASEKTLLQIYQDYQRDQLNKTNEMFTDVAIGKFSELLEHLNFIENGVQLGRELSDNEPFRQDVKFIVEYITPYVPLIGLFSGTLIVGKHVVNNKVSSFNKEECKNQQKETKSQEKTKEEKQTTS